MDCPICLDPYTADRRPCCTPCGTYLPWPRQPCIIASLLRRFTSTGHIFCIPCIGKNTFSSCYPLPACPVCRATYSPETVIHLFLPTGHSAPQPPPLLPAIAIFSQPEHSRERRVSMTDCIRTAFDKIRKELSHCMARERKLTASLARAEDLIAFLKTQLFEKERRERELELELSKVKKLRLSHASAELITPHVPTDMDEHCTKTP
ncbi:hypothetical protein BOTBODRAFT_487151 [Botryobasidium botryosum FD-172 SS1]|uniref:RING-type domain-containing protein n=1 Tax=Botryobasidium botryosum (strain FD-172 SS1) TaxID=930990 RepID=A0A067M7F9_BOTB1|nr:hypothetical protein BOTBODRAFT_487151 [Botryobasidium botryosum FD-172 SS1]